MGVVMHLPYRSPVSDASLEMHWFPVWERFTFKFTVLTHEAHRTCQPTYLPNLLVDRAGWVGLGRLGPRLLRSASNTTQLVVPRTHYKRRTRAFSFAAPVVWNSLPKCTRDCISLPVFNSAEHIPVQQTYKYLNYQTSGRAYVSDYYLGIMACYK